MVEADIPAVEEADISVVVDTVIEAVESTAAVEVDIIVTVAVVLVKLTDSYPTGGHSSGEWNPTLSKDHVSSKVPE